MEDLNISIMEVVKKIVMGSVRSMGVEVVD